MVAPVTQYSVVGGYLHQSLMHRNRGHLPSHTQGHLSSVAAATEVSGLGPSEGDRTPELPPSGEQSSTPALRCCDLLHQLPVGTGGLNVLLQNPFSMSLNLQVEHREFFQGLGRGRCSSAHNCWSLGISKLCVSERGLPGPIFQQDHTTPTHQLLGKLRNTKNYTSIPTESQSKCHQASH